MHLRHVVPVLSVADVDKTLTFYQDALGFSVQNRYEHNGHLQWACVRAGDTELMFTRCELAQSVLPLARKEDLTLYFYPDDVEALHAALQTRGYAVSDLEVTFYGMKECVLTDPDGYRLSFGQPVDVPSVA